MGLFKRKKNPAKERLKELTGGLVFSNEFKTLLKENNIKLSRAISITNQIKDEIDKGIVDENNVDARLNELLNQAIKETPNNNPTKSCPQCGLKQDESHNVCIECGYHFNSPKITCPKCRTKQDNVNRFCIECGYNLKEKPIKDTTPAHMITFLYNQKHNLKTCPECSAKFLKADNFCHSCGYQNPKIEPNKILQEEDSLDELEALYSKSVSSKYSLISNSHMCSF